ncbi:MULTISPECIES: esterase/lipase family protein [Prochlorococcus]|uniref:esterase/lipase family protein n=1 Tax=Prochlorococcus TaxID=1218 RepID=UPI00053376CE|nr:MULTISPECIES: alpha/beta fold hydrolase [Prochlorococcus]KGG12288.1 lipase [Prochlorococcus sp. MIT 0601]
MRFLKRPLVLIHGLWDTPSIFDRLIHCLDVPHRMIYAPHLPHQFGRRSIFELATDFESLICRRFANNVSIDILGFSMGGLIGRTWLQELGGANRTSRFISVGSPQNGTLTAQLVPSFIFPGIADMKLGSQLIISLDKSSHALDNVECISYFCGIDLMVFPGWRATLPCGETKSVPVLSHKALIARSTGVDSLVKEIFNTN